MYNVTHVKPFTASYIRLYHKYYVSSLLNLFESITFKEKDLGICRNTKYGIIYNISGMGAVWNKTVYTNTYSLTAVNIFIHADTPNLVLPYAMLRNSTQHHCCHCSMVSCILHDPWDGAKNMCAVQAYLPQYQLCYFICWEHNYTVKQLICFVEIFIVCNNAPCPLKIMI